MLKWLFAGSELKKRGVVGINQRNLAFILPRNPRSRMYLANDKYLLHQMCERLHIPTPRVYALLRSPGDVGRFFRSPIASTEFVLKPNRGSGGRGIVVGSLQNEKFVAADGRTWLLDELHHHAQEILAGLYSLGGRGDTVLVQERLSAAASVQRLSVAGLPDVRLLLVDGRPVQAMLRLATRASRGRANLHQGGIGVGIDIETGRTGFGILGTQRIERHPDSGLALGNVLIPAWSACLEVAQRTAEGIGLGYLGIDLVIDELRGPLVLEANARPGLNIQLANGRGTIEALRRCEIGSKALSEKGDCD